MLYNPMVDDTTSFVSRFQTLGLCLTASTGGDLPFTLSPTLDATTLLYSATPLAYDTGAGLGNQINGMPLGSGAPSINTASANYFTGRSDNYMPGTSGNPLSARFDPESVRVSGDGRASSSPTSTARIRQFDRATGQLLNTITLPAKLDVTNQPPRAPSRSPATQSAGSRTRAWKDW